MGKKGFWTALIGGIILFAWNAYNWAYIPWDCLTIHQFENEAEMALLLQQSAKEDGMYILPAVPCHLKNMSGPWGKLYRSQTLKAKKEGPTMFAVVSLEGSAEERYTPFISSFIINFICASVVAWILTRLRQERYWKKVWTVTLLGFTMGFFTYMPLWNWEGFSFLFVGFNILYPTVGWFFAALAMSAMTKEANSS